MESEERRLFLFPVRRRLVVLTLMYLTGVHLAAAVGLPLWLTLLLLVMLMAAGLLLRRRRLSVFGVACTMMLLLGNGLSARLLAICDPPTQPGTAISGVVEAIERDHRVRLRDVRYADGSGPARSVVVTLMLPKEEGNLPPSPQVGQRVEGTGRLFAQDVPRNPGGFDARLRAMTRGYELTGYLLAGWTAQGDACFSVGEALRGMRLWLTAHINELFGGQAPLFLALMLGEEDALDAGMTSAMRMTGTAHLLSVSGMHLSVVSSALAALFRLLHLPKRPAMALRAVVLLLFAGVTGFAVGTVRALIMTLVRMLARLRGQRYDPLTALAFSALAITLVNPLYAFDAGFRFSFLVVLGIHLLVPALSFCGAGRWMTRHMRPIAQALIVCVSAQIASMPMQLLLYGYLPVLALPMNLISGVFSSVMMIGGWLAALAGVPAPQAGRAMASLLGAAAAMFEAASLWAASLDWAIVRLPAPHALLLVFFAAAMALASPTVRFGGRRRIALAGVTAAIALAYVPRFDPSAQYVQLDVGQGDSAVIRCGNQAVVVDTGPAYDYELLHYLRHEGLRVEAVILSHCDEDHAGALPVLLRSEIEVPRVIMAHRAGEDVASPVVMEGFDLLEESDARVDYVGAGDSMELLNMKFSVLSPDEALKGSNERSLVLQVRAQECCLLLTGDLPAQCEPECVPDCDMLKVAHHGSKNATSPAFIEQAQPELAIISVGAGNSYGHPHARVLCDLSAAGARVIRTDEAGCITVPLDGEMEAETFMRGKEE